MTNTEKVRLMQERDGWKCVEYGIIFATCMYWLDGFLRLDSHSDCASRHGMHELFMVLTCATVVYDLFAQISGRGQGRTGQSWSLGVYMHILEEHVSTAGDIPSTSAPWVCRRATTESN